MFLAIFGGLHITIDLMFPEIIKVHNDCTNSTTKINIILYDVPQNIV